MFIPYKVDVPMQRWPLADFALIGVTCAISIYFFCTGMDDNPAFNYYLLQPDDFKLTQLIGSLFIHLGWVHLIGNMVFLWVFGNAVNAKMGHLGYLGLYLCAGIFEGIVWYFLGPHVSHFGIQFPERAAALGASGAIMGVIGAFLVLYPKNDVSIAFVFYRIGSFEASAYWVIAVYVGLDIYGLVHQSEGVGYLAHVAGMSFGLGVTAAAVHLGFFAPTRHEENLLQMWGIRPRTAEKSIAAPVIARYLIEARDPASGFKTQLKVVARSELEARNQAIHDGLTVDRITRIL